jgi:hypothetical protein
MDLATNPFAVLTVVAAPALLTNSTAVLALSTSNRFLRASDRMRSLAGQLENASLPSHLRELLARQVTRVERQAVLLLNALRAIYLALGCFAGATIISIVGAVFASVPVHGAVVVAIALAFLAGLAGVGGLIFGAANLLSATRLSLLNIKEEAAMIRERHAGAKNSPL